MGTTDTETRTSSEGSITIAELEALAGTAAELEKLAAENWERLTPEAKKGFDELLSRMRKKAAKM